MTLPSSLVSKATDKQVVFGVDFGSDQLQQRIAHLNDADHKRIATAFYVAEVAHRGQKRRSGEDYITHPVTVATTVASMGMDSHAIMAALLHDVVEDCAVTLAEISKKFDGKTAKIVDGLTKLVHLEQATDAVKQAHNFQKMVLAMCDDVRVIAVKMADRLHNMHTLGAMPRAKQRFIARETEEIYVGIARRLGMNDIADELEDLCFRCQYPMRHMLITKALQTAHVRNQDYLHHIEQAIRSKLSDMNITSRVLGRQKAPASIYYKMRGDRRKKNEKVESTFMSFYKIMDIHGVRIIVATVDDCYRALGTLHQLYKPVPGRFKDYIANAKPNGYQSLHTTLLGPKQFPIEVQIRTAAMNRYIEHGIAVHWLYKETEETSAFATKQTQWLVQLKELQAKSANPAEFLEAVKKDFYEQEIYVFTRESDIITLPHGASAIDFAYSVHTDLGNRASECRVDGVTMEITSRLKTGQHVEIITADEVMVNATWLRYAVTSRAVASIKQQIQKHQTLQTPTIYQAVDLVALGTSLLRNYMQTLDLPKPSERRIRNALVKLGKQTKKEVYKAIGEQSMSPFACIAALFPPTAYHPKVPLGKRHSVQIAKCCLPLPDENIVVLASNRGLLLHLAHCHNATRYQRTQDILPVSWSKTWVAPLQFTTHLRVRVRFADRGVFTTIANIMTKKGALVNKIRTVDIDNTSAFFDVWLMVKNRTHALEVMTAVRRFRATQSVVRVR